MISPTVSHVNAAQISQLATQALQSPKYYIEGAIYVALVADGKYVLGHRDDHTLMQLGRHWEKTFKRRFPKYVAGTTIPNDSRWAFITPEQIKKAIRRLNSIN